MKAKACLAAVCTVLVLQACSVGPINQEVKEEIKKTRADSAVAQAALEEAKKVGPVVRMRAAKIGGDEIEIKPEVALPPILRKTFTYVTQNEPLSAVAEDIGRKAGIPVRLVNVAQIDGDSAAAGAPDREAKPAMGNKPIDMSYSGSLSGLLDLMAQKSKSYWRYVDGGIEFFEVETRTFQIFLSPGKRSVASSISLAGASGGGGTDQSGGGGSSGGGTVSVEATQTIDAYASLVASVEALIEERNDQPLSAGNSGAKPTGQAGAAAASEGVATSTLGKSRVVANPALGMITVTATPPVLSRVANYIKTVNDRFASNVRIEVKIYSLSVKRDANVGFSADLVYSKLGQYGLGLSPQGLLQAAGGAPSRLIAGVTDPNSRFQGSALLVQALSEFGDVGFVTSGEILAPNGQPSPLQIADEITYLSSISTVQTPNVGSTTTLVPATRTVGFTANFVPLVLGDNRILLQYEINLSQLASMSQITSAGATIQTPNIRQQSLQQQAFVRDGQMIVLFGFESSRAETNNNEGITGVSNNASKSRQMTIITMQVHGGRGV